jgi:hypothetical protein
MSAINFIYLLEEILELLNSSDKCVDFAIKSQFLLKYPNFVI